MRNSCVGVGNAYLLYPTHTQGGARLTELGGIGPSHTGTQEAVLGRICGRFIN